MTTFYIYNMQCKIFHIKLSGSLDKKSQIVCWWVTHGDEWCFYTKIMFCRNFRIFEKKLAEGSVHLVYNGIYKNIQKPKIFISGIKVYLYELICHSHIDQEQTRTVCLTKKFSLIWDLWFLRLQWSCIGIAKLLNLKLIKCFLIKLFFFIK